MTITQSPAALPPVPPRLQTLATALSVAVRIEPELIRAVRLAILPVLDVGYEADLWFSPLVSVREPNSIIFDHEVRRLLHVKLADMLGEADCAESFRNLWQVISHVHSGISPALAMEEHITWLAISEGRRAAPKIDAELQRAFDALVGQQREGIADWFAAAWSRLPDTVRATKGAWKLQNAVRLTRGTILEPGAPADPSIGAVDLADLIDLLPDVKLYVHRDEHTLEIGAVQPRDGTVSIQVPDTDPRIVEIDNELGAATNEETSISIRRGETVRVPIGSGSVRLRTPRGLVYEIPKARLKVRAMRHPGVTDTTATPQLDGENPWPGLESYQESARAFFHGRDHESASLLSHVRDAPVTVFYGRSGLGKTSLLRAGLFPLLRDDDFLPVYVRFELMPGAASLTRQLHQSVHNSIRADLPEAMLPSDEESLWEYLHRADFDLRSAQNYPLTPVIVLDQFEELFTLGERVPDLVWEFRDDLRDLAENRIPAELAARIDDDKAAAKRFQLRSRNYRLLISLREDFLPDLEGWCRLIPALGRSRLRLLPLRANEAVDAVYKPASLLMTQELARRVVRIIAGEEVHRGRAGASPDAVGTGNPLVRAEFEPALLSLFCRELNEERKRRGQDRFDEQLVEDAKRDVLSNYYSSCVRNLPERVARFIETELITEKGFRDGYVREDAVPAHLTEDELAQLIASRLLRLEDRYGAQRIELTHDVLTGVVREHRDRRRAEEERAALVARMEQERQALAQAAAQREAELDRELRVERERRLESEARAARRRPWRWFSRPGE